MHVGEEETPAPASPYNVGYLAILNELHKRYNWRRSFDRARPAVKRAPVVIDLCTDDAAAAAKPAPDRRAREKAPYAEREQRERRSFPARHRKSSVRSVIKNNF